MTENEEKSWLDGDEGITPYLRMKDNGMPREKISQIAWLLLNGSGCGFCKMCRDEPCNIKVGESCTINIANYIRKIVLEEFEIELRQYRAIGTVEELKEAKEKSMLDNESDIICSLTTIPSTDGNFKSALHRATTSQIRQALQLMEGKSGNRSRTDSCRRELRKRTADRRKALSAYNAIREYCASQEKCDGCLFEMEEGAPGVCVMEVQDVPSGWKELDQQNINR